MSLVAQLKGRRVFRAIFGYGVVLFAVLQVVEPLMHGLHLPDATLTWVLIALGAAFPVVVGAALVLDAREGAAPRLDRRWLAAAGALLVLAGIVTLLSRRHPPASVPRLRQVTFAGGIEHSPAWSPDGKRIVYAAQAGRVRKIFRKDIGTGEPVQLTHGDFDDQQPAWSPDGKSILFLRAQERGAPLQPGDVYGVFDNADVWRLDIGTGEETLLIANAFGATWSPSGAQIAVDASWAGPHRIWVLDANGHNPVQVTTDVSEDVIHNAPRWGPDGKHLVFQNQERTKFDIRVVDVDTKKLSWVTDDAWFDVQPVWSPSGAFIYFSSDRGGSMNLWRAPVNADGSVSGSLEQVTTGAGHDIEPSVSPDAKRLAFTTVRQNADLWKLPVSASGDPTGAPEPVVSTTREDSRGAWSPDGREIAFNSDRSGEMSIWIASVDGRSTRRLTSGGGGDFQPQWSPDGKEIVFFSARAGSPNIWKVDVGSGRLSALTGGRAVDVSPFFSPDGKWIAYQSDRSGRLEVWVMRPDGTEAHQLSSTGVYGHFIRWTPASDAVVYRCPCGGKQQILATPVAGGPARPFATIKGGSHMSFSPDASTIMDVVAHRALWASPVKAGAPRKIFEFPDADARIDYPVWSPDGNWILFDRTFPQGGEVWVLSDVE